MFPLVSHLAVISGLFTSIDAHYVDLSVILLSVIVLECWIGYKFQSSHKLMGSLLAF
jgi:hypothetical protein